MSANDRTTRPTKPSLTLEAAALAYAAALDAYHEERGRLIARHVERTGSRIGSLVGARVALRMAPVTHALGEAERAMGRAAVAMWKATERRRRGARKQ